MKVAKQNLNSWQKMLTLCMSLLFLSNSLLAQKISGKVVDKNKEPLIGASVLVKDSKNGTIADGSGAFSLDNVAKNSTLVVSFIGYTTKEVVAEDNLTIVLEEGNTLGDVIVTGVFDKRTALNSSIAISTLSAAQIEKIVPNSAADLLKNVPGVFVNSSLGEIRNTVNSRGVTTGNNDGRWGYDYVSMQEDGLPVLNSPLGNFSPDFFLRADATLDRLEAVRGGTASIAGANAPGGIFNYISKTGGSQLAGELRTRLGLEGNGKNAYYRGDINFGGPLSDNLTYNIGGFYRQSEGPQYPGYASNFGGQIKGNLVYKYGAGSLKLLVKVLNDHNLTAEGIPTLGYTDMQPATGFDNTSSMLPPAINITTKVLDRGNVTYNPSDLWHSKENAFGLNWEHNLGESGWKVTNNARYSVKSNEAFTPLSVATPIAMDHIVTYFILGSLHPPTQIIPGTYNIVSGGKSIMTVKSFSGFDYHVIANTAPGSTLAPNSLLFTPLIYQNYKVNEFLDQFNFSKKTKDMTFNVGGFFGRSGFDGVQGSMGVSLNTIENHPQPVNITATNPGGITYNLTNPNGVVNVGADQGYALFNSTQTQMALFFAHTWEINKELTFDWGARYENMSTKGTNNNRALAPVNGGAGADNNPLTLFDNTEAVKGSAYTYNKSLSYISFSGALNYKLSDHSAIYGRYSNGKKAPGLQLYFDVTSDFAVSNLNPQIQTIQQFELGYKLKTEKVSTTVTPFYSTLTHIPNNVTFTNSSGALYNPLPLYNDLKTYGVELEGNVQLSKYFNIRGVVTLQGSTATKYQSWIHLPAGNASGGDSLVTNSGNKTANVPNLMMNITPELNIGAFYAGLTYSYMGARQANFANAFELPSFSQMNLSLGYSVTPQFRLSANINNLGNTYGIMGWVGPGTFPDNLNLEGMTKAAVAANPTALHQVLGTPARAYFVSAAYKF
jgi:iron complex outermembrane recepter protein